MSAEAPCAGCGALLPTKKLPLCGHCRTIMENGFEETAGSRDRKVAVSTLSHFPKGEQTLISLLDAALPGLEGKDKAAARKIVRNMRTGEPKRGWQIETRAILDRVLMVQP